MGLQWYGPCGVDRRFEVSPELRRVPLGTAYGRLESSNEVVIQTVATGSCVVNSAFAKTDMDF